MTPEPPAPAPSPASPPRTVVLGLGNPLLSDDALGLHFAAALEDLLAAEPVAGVQVVTSERGGFELLDLLSGAERAVIVDCLEVPDPCPGRVRQLALDRIAGVARLVGAHDLNIATVFRLASEMGVAMPEKVEIYGVEAADTRSFGERLSGEVETAVRALARDLHARLKEEAGRPAPPSASAA